MIKNAPILLLKSAGAEPHAASTAKLIFFISSFAYSGMVRSCLQPKETDAIHTCHSTHVPPWTRKHMFTSLRSRIPHACQALYMSEGISHASTSGPSIEYTCSAAERGIASAPTPNQKMIFSDERHTSKRQDPHLSSERLDCFNLSSERLGCFNGSGELPK